MQQEIESLGLELFDEMKGEKPGVFNSDYWQGKLMDWVMKDPDFKVDLFHFVDVLPQLKSSKQVAKHIREYLLKDGRTLPSVINVALKAAASNLTAGVAAMSIRKNVGDLGERFIVGHEAKSALKELSRLHKEGIGFTVDLLGEHTLSEKEADDYYKRYEALIENLADSCAAWNPDPIIDENHLGQIPRVNVSIKVTALDSQLKLEDPKYSVDRLFKRVLPLCLLAKKHKVFINFDLEQYSVHEITYDLFEAVLSHEELKDYPHLGIVVQAYLKHAKKDLERLLKIAQFRKTPIGVRLVKGAYWDYELVRAKENGFDCPVFTEKPQSDINFENLSRFLLDNINYFQPAFASHNLRSVAQAIVYAEQNKIPKNAYEIQMLYGMAEPERKVLRARRHRVRVYAPIGDLLPGMSYLVRRLLENTSNSGFLKLTHQDHLDPKILMAEPVSELEQDTCHFELDPESSSRQGACWTPHQVRGDNVSLQGDKAFVNCPFTDFTKPENRESYEKALSAWEPKLPQSVPVILSGEKQPGELIFERISPNNDTKRVSKVELASIEQANQAAKIAYAAYPKWRDSNLKNRAGLLDKLADILERDRFELAALMSIEIAKPWAEADADLAEAVDFCRYYAFQAFEELGVRKQGNIWGEDSRMHYEGRGPCLVIAPWNFPLAILCGMSVAALVAGNPVIMKPAENSSLVAKLLFDRMIEAGFPKEVVQFLPGQGKKVGAYLVEHPKVAQIAFTGSKNVGLEIINKASKVQSGQSQVKRVVCEMGGKNAIIIDDDADLDEAVSGVVHSMIGYAGQKCSAASRVLVLDSIYEQFASRLVEALRSVEQKSATLAACVLGPVVDKTSQERLINEIESAKKEHKTLFVSETPKEGCFAPMAVFEVENIKSRLMQHEFFGPILALKRVKSFEEALDVANDTEFALTGAVFSRSPKHLMDARKAFRVGNLYLNSGSTGAMVDRQPFGGFKMSGIGTKAGGPGYLLNFADPRCVTENTLRRGFTPELS